MTNTSPPQWSTELTQRFGERLRQVRRSMSAKDLSARCTELGYPISPQVIAKLDSGHRGAHLEVAELIILARALNVAPLVLLYDVTPWGTVEVTPGVTVPMLRAAEWFTGEKFLEEEVLNSIADEVRIQFQALHGQLVEDVDAAEERVVDTITEAWTYHTVSASNPPDTEILGPDNHA